MDFESLIYKGNCKKTKSLKSNMHMMYFNLQCVSKSNQQFSGTPNCCVILQVMYFYRMTNINLPLFHFQHTIAAQNLSFEQLHIGLGAYLSGKPSQQ